MLPVRGGSIGLAMVMGMDIAMGMGMDMGTGPWGCSVRLRKTGKCRSCRAAPRGRRCGECAGVASGV